MQLTHYNHPFKAQQFPITLVCNNFNLAANMGSLFRTCDAFGVEKIIFTNEFTLNRKIIATSRNTTNIVPFEIIQNINPYLENLNHSHCIIALEITKKSKPIQYLKFSSKKPIILIIGNENFGIPESLLNLANTHAHIVMYGNNSSMNVVQATSIALYEITKQIL